MRLARRYASLLGCAALLLAAACAPAAAQKIETVPSITLTAPAAATGECQETPGGGENCPPDSHSPSETPASPPRTEPVSPEAPALTATHTPLPFPTEAPAATETAAPAPAPCTADLCVYNSPLFLQRPIAPPANQMIDASYRFGSTQSGQRDPHHGVELLNGYGTPVLAAADGKVVVAGTDVDPTSARGVWPITFYGPYSNFYGNLIVLEHTPPETLAASLPQPPAPIYTLYGHLSEIGVQVGQEVQAGQQIGKVGMAGIATGSHLHFEVRYGENSYKASRNPEMWLAPSVDENGAPNGALAGLFLDVYGEVMEMPSIVLQHLPQGPDGPSDLELTLLTYEEKGLRGQPPFLDSFGAGDLPAGWYRISFPMGGLRQELVQVYPGQLTLATFRSP